MKRLARLFAPFLLIAVLPPIQSMSAAGENNAEKELLDVEAKITSAYLSKSVEVFSQLTDSELSAFHASNPYRIDDKKSVQDALAIFYKNASPTGLYKLQPRVQVYGDVAVVTYHFLETGGEGAKSYAYEGKQTDVFVKKQGKWMLVHFHSSRTVRPH